MEGSAVDWIIFGLVVGWLGIISWFDIRTNEIPHSGWVVLPLIGAGVYRAWQGGWELVLLTVLVAGVSERERISQRLGWEEIGRMIPWYPWIFLGAFFSMQASPYAALAIIGFWVAWELKWWGGCGRGIGDCPGISTANLSSCFFSCACGCLHRACYLFIDY